MVNTAALTKQYIEEHASVKMCLAAGLINYSALARMIALEYGLIKQTSIEAIVVAARRIKRGLADRVDVHKFFADSSIRIENNIVAYTLDRSTLTEKIMQIEKEIKSAHGIFFAIEGTRSITIITNAAHEKLLQKSFSRLVLEKFADQVLITISAPGIQEVAGAVHHVTSLLFDRGVNITELISCHDDTIFVIDKDATAKAIEALRF